MDHIRNILKKCQKQTILDMFLSKEAQESSNARKQKRERTPEW
jgi:hypothetical protein